MNIAYLLIAILLLAPPQKSSIIPWSASRKLTMKDFTEVSHYQNKQAYSGQTWSGIEPEYRTDGITLTYKVPALFNKDSSWMVVYDEAHDADLNVNWMNNRAATYGLSHEQIHFDITEVYARKIRKMFREEISRANVDEIENMLQDYFTEWEAFQDQYDQETQHSLDTVKQELWSGKVQRLLRQLNDYDMPEGSVRLKGRR